MSACLRHPRLERSSPPPTSGVSGDGWGLDRGLLWSREAVASGVTRGRPAEPSRRQVNGVCSAFLRLCSQLHAQPPAVPLSRSWLAASNASGSAQLKPAGRRHGTSCSPPASRLFCLSGSTITSIWSWLVDWPSTLPRSPALVRMSSACKRRWAGVDACLRARQPAPIRKVTPKVTRQRDIALFALLCLLVSWGDTTHFLRTSSLAWPRWGPLLGMVCSRCSFAGDTSCGAPSRAPRSLMPQFGQASVPAKMMVSSSSRVSRMPKAAFARSLCATPANR